MNLGKRIAAAVIAAATAITALSVSAFAADVIGTNPTKLKEGEQVTFQISYDDSRNYNDGHNYQDFTYDVPGDGNLKITFDSQMEYTRVLFYRDDTKEMVKNYNYVDGTGSYYNDYAFYWSKDSGLYSGKLYVPVSKGKYIIRVSRYFLGSGRSYDPYKGQSGNGRVHLTAEMEKPDAPQEIQITDKTDTTARLQWREPEEGTSYDIRYKAGSGKWTIVSDINDNNVTLTKLTGATKYTYQMRTHAGDIVGDWSKAASFKTTDPKNVKFDTPKFKTAVAVHIEWNAVKNATGYKFQYSTDQKNWKTITVKDAAVDMPVVSGKTYYYKVAAKNSAKTGSFSKVASIKIG